MISRPQPGEYRSEFENYMKLIGERDVLSVLKDQTQQAFWHKIPNEKEHFRYAEGKWTVKEVFGHVLDCERIMAYRALSLARGEKQPLPGFDEDAYVAHAHFSERTLDSLAMEMHFVRASTIMLFASLREEDLLRKGVVNGKEISVRALAYVIAGHELHHIRILSERYLNQQWQMIGSN